LWIDLRLTAADRGQDMDARRRLDRRREIRRHPVHKDIDVRPEPRSGLDQPVAQAGHGSIQCPDNCSDRIALDLMPACGARKECEQ